MVLFATFRRGLTLQGSKKMSIFNSKRTMAYGSKHGAFNGQRLPDFLNADVNGNTLGPGLYATFIVMLSMLSGPFYWEYIRPKNQDDSYL